jgi:hypothetical protein
MIFGLIFLALISLPLTLLAIYHCFLVIRGMSTSEQIKQLRLSNAKQEVKDSNQNRIQETRSSKKDNLGSRFKNIICVPNQPRVIDWNNFKPAIKTMEMNQYP